VAALTALARESVENARAILDRALGGDERRSRSFDRRTARTELMAGPKREIFKASDVCEIAQLQPYMLRTWETEFPGLGHVPAGGGPRMYRRADVELVLRIRQLVFNEGLTLAGARRRLEEETAAPRSVASFAVDDALDDLAKSRLRNIRAGLEEILELLGRDAATAANELQLVPPDDGPGHVAAQASRERQVAKPSKGNATKGGRSKAARAS
jgi:DNA-binding transcriptional MerR regulator